MLRARWKARWELNEGASEIAHHSGEPPKRSTGNPSPRFDVFISIEGRHGGTQHALLHPPPLNLIHTHPHVRAFTDGSDFSQQFDVEACECRVCENEAQCGGEAQERKREHRYEHGYDDHLFARGGLLRADPHVHSLSSLRLVMAGRCCCCTANQTAAMMTGGKSTGCVH